MQRCPDCGKVAVCFHNDVGDGNIYIDRYCLYCPSCGFTEYGQDQVSGNQIDQLVATICPFCQTSSHDHILLPPILNIRFQNKQSLH